MSRKLTIVSTLLLWLLVIVVALSAARYFLNPAPWLTHAAALALARHRVWLLLHIAGGIVALVAGPFQFLGSVRNSHPAAHRATGYAYLTAVLLGSCAALRLSPDTAQLLVDGFRETKFFDLPLIGMASSAFGLSTKYDRAQFLPVVLGFAVLGLLWFVISGIAFVRARQRQFADHRAWMIRSYSLTFAAVTVRLAAIPLLLLTRSPVVAATLTFWSWTLNLVVAEWLVRRTRERPALRMAAR